VTAMSSSAAILPAGLGVLGRPKAAQRGFRLVEFLNADGRGPGDETQAGGRDFGGLAVLIGLVEGAGLGQAAPTGVVL